MALAKLVTAKESLLKAALGAPICPFSRQKTLSDSRGSKGNLDSDSVHAYTTPNNEAL